MLQLRAIFIFFFAVFCDELTVILPALNKMPNLKTLDLGGNNFSNIRPKMLPNLLVELVKLMNDDEKVGIEVERS